MKRRTLVSIATALICTAFSGVPATADSLSGGCGSSTSLGGQVITSAQSGCVNGDSSQVSGYYNDANKSRLINNGPKIQYKVLYFRQCEPSLVNLLGCDANPDPPCADGSYPMLRLIYPLNGPRKGQQISRQSYCSNEPPADIPGAEQDIAKVTPERFRELPILASTIISQPENFSLRNGHAHLYADSENQDFNIVIFDQDVRVRAIPTSYSWSYGDGSSRTLNFPGEAQANRGFDAPTSTSHVYKETGDFGVGLSTRFRGEFSTEGGPWTPIPGVANVPSTSVTMSVWRTKKVLVAENCQATPGGPGCASIFE